MKRCIDILASGFLLLLTLPLLVMTAVAIWLQDRGPILFRQQRAGITGRPFEMLKLRSMWVNNAPAARMGKVDEDHPLITPVGRVLRRFKMDEIPQLWNVFRGDMSLVGPRPTLLEQVADYGEFERRRLAVRPGMTGWAQINGGIEIPWPDRILLDVWYVDHRSFALDLRILWRTFTVLFSGEKANPSALERAMAYAHDVYHVTTVVDPTR